MKSILWQLSRYRYAEPVKDVVSLNTVVGSDYRVLLGRLCADEVLLDRALKKLDDFVVPPLAGKLYPLELALLYHLFYRHQLVICGEDVVDACMVGFLGAVGCMDDYMVRLKSSLSNDGIKIFLFRVMLAGLTSRNCLEGWRRDVLDRSYGMMAAGALGVEVSLRVAGAGLDSLSRSSIEDQILGRIMYVAFWEWSQGRSVDMCGDFFVG